MKRTRKMMLVTLMATTAIAMLLMSRALAAPSTCPLSGQTAGTISTNTCPTSSLLNQLTGSNGSSLNSTSNACPSAAALQQLLKNYSLTAGSTSGSCPTASTLQQLLSKYGITGNLTSTCPKSNGTGTTAASAPVTTPAPTTAPSATTAPVTGTMSADEQKMINLVNQDRASNGGLPALKFDPTLRAGALAHSQDMSANNYFSHTSPTLGDFGTRIKAAGVSYTAAGENIAMYPSVEQAEVGFMNSPGHRANILGDYTRVGIGIVYNQSKGEYYITQWFAK